MPGDGCRSRASALRGLKSLCSSRAAAGTLARTMDRGRLTLYVIILQISSGIHGIYFNKLYDNPHEDVDYEGDSNSPG